MLDIVWFDEDLVLLELLGALLIFAVTFVIAFYKLCEQHKARKLSEQQVQAELEDRDAKANESEELDQPKKAPPSLGL